MVLLLHKLKIEYHQLKKMFNCHNRHNSVINRAKTGFIFSTFLLVREKKKVENINLNNLQLFSFRAVCRTQQTEYYITVSKDQISSEQGKAHVNRALKEKGHLNNVNSRN